ncbi:Signal transduction histidine kinase [Candidatus Terasakiella magnetica]|nr:Signal transduction histidine kinase [Candidatus Terasakiella magnetica]
MSGMVEPSNLRGGRRLVMATALVLLGIWLTGSLVVWHDRETALADARRLTFSLTRAAAERISGSLKGVDLLLQDAAAKAPATALRDDEAFLAYIRGRGAAFPEVRNVFLVGADGRVRAGTVAALNEVDLSGRGYFQAARQRQAAPTLHLTGLMTSPVVHRPTILAVRPLVGALGTFDGIIMAAVDPAFFLETLNGVLSNEVDRAVLANLDGEVMARLPDPEMAVGASIRNGALFATYLPRAPSGSFVAPSTFDGKERLASYITIAPFPLVVSVGVTVEAALARWRSGTAMVAVIGGGLTGIVMLGAILLVRRDEAERRAIAALAESEASYRILVENQDDLIHRYRPDTTLISINSAYAEFYGKPASELLGRPWLEWLPENERPGALSALKSMTRSNPHREDQRQVIRFDGEARWIEWRSTALFNASGRLIGYQSSGRDITDQYRVRQAIAEREELYSQSFHRNMAVKLLVDPTDGTIVDANESASKFYGYPSGTLKTMTIGEINTLPPEQVAQEMEAVARNERRFMCFRHRLASGVIRDVEVYSSPLHVNGRVYLSSIIMDVTERNHFETELKAKTLELERSNSDLEQFAYVASHDLRQPLRLVSSYISMLEKRLAGRLNDQEVEFMGYAVGGVRRMDALILGLLEYSRVGRGEDTMVMVDLAEMVEQAAANLGIGQVLSDAHLTIERPLPTLFGMRNELIRLFQNLLGNALKYRHPERPVQLGVSARRRLQEKDWVITVADNGMGIDPDYFERIFKMFQRLHTEGTHEGTGIGLAICKKIVETHGGRIWVESEVGVGSRFLFSLPEGKPSSIVREVDAPTALEEL